MPDKSSNVTSSIVYFAIGAASLKIVKVSNNPELSSQQLNRFLPVKNKHWRIIGKINSKKK